ncbi:MAG: sigma-70 family RNA polymerase sigma factor [Planctomycetes bacterium]|nr:sigma-70 family RNA polymerase sigma factor [Planctomycetota bacterium]MBI3847646.1 sigma-70 family RNA polymerase sigma factor [Planctomycetota bacterium]
MNPTDAVTRFLDEWRQGDATVLPKLLAVLYDEMHRIAERQLRHERSDHTLQPTALVHEAYLRLVDQRSQNFENRAHFLAVASTAMRRVLMQHARGRDAQKRGGGRVQVTLGDVAGAFEERATDLVALDDALERLEQFDPVKSRIVELRFFGGLTIEEIADVLGIATRTVERDWRAARAWLKVEVGKRLDDERPDGTQD